MSTNSPNVIFFMVDQMGAKWLEAAMDGACDLPNLKRLQAIGCTFTNAYSSNPVCCPARATIATGLSNHGHGLISNGYRLNPEIPTFMRTLQTAGWRTGAFGKIHFYPYDSDHYPYPDYREYGWDAVHNSNDTRTGEWLDWIKSEHPKHFEAAVSTADGWSAELPYFDAYGEDRINLTEIMRREKAKRALPKETGFDCYPLPFPEELSQTNWITDRALDFIREAPEGRSLYTHISYVQPHPAFTTPERFLDKVNVGRIPEPVGMDKGIDIAPGWREARKFYFADFMHIDEQIGRVLALLDETGRTENSYFVFTADHGEMLHDHGRLSKSHNHYDPVYRVPLIIAGPGVKAGSSCDAFVQHEDICPTVLDMDPTALEHHPRKLFRKSLENETPVFHGRSLMPWCRGETVEDWRTSALIESFGCLCEGPNSGLIRESWKKTLRNSEYRYSVTVGHDTEELIDLKKDPDELNNVADDPGYSDALHDMRHRMLNRLMLQDYPLPPRDLLVIGAH